MITSILDNDFYKFTQQNAVLKCYPGVCAQYRFQNRRPEGKFTPKFLQALEEQIQNMQTLILSDQEEIWLKEKLPILDSQYLAYLRSYRYDPSEVTVRLNHGELELEINGLWERTILWEVPLMALISEIYFKYCDTNWSYEHQTNRLQNKLITLKSVTFADFGTRRRRSKETQDLVIREIWKEQKRNRDIAFLGTSNLYFAKQYHLYPIGTMAHEWIMAVSAIEGLIRANYHALQAWKRVYRGRLGIALTDTFGSEVFFRDFDYELSRSFDGVRHDSGDPISFIKKVIEHYKSMNIDPLTKMIVFSDGLSALQAHNIFHWFNDRIKCVFGIGTHLTNDFEYSPALNMVIKMSSCNGIPVVKLSDVPTKQSGDPDALQVANWTFYREPLS